MIMSEITLSLTDPVPVWTFNVSPDSVYGEGNHYTFDAFGILSTARKFADWRLRVVNVQIPL